MLQKYSEIKFTVSDITILISFRLRFSHYFFYVLHLDVFYHLSANNEMRQLSIVVYIVRGEWDDRKMSREN